MSPLVVMVTAGLLAVTYCVQVDPGTLTGNVSMFLEEYDRQFSAILYTAVEEEWTYATNITQYNQQVKVNGSLKRSKLSRAWGLAAMNLTSNNVTEERMLTKIRDIGTAAQTDESKVEKLENSKSDMETIYSKGKFCPNATCCLSLDPDLTSLFENSRDYDRLLAAWKGWRDVTGPAMKPHFIDYVNLKNEALRLANFSDAGEYWRSWYDTESFEQDLRDLFTQLRPLYEQLHAYVRRKLKAHYGADKFPSTGHIPAHLFGNMWAQHWDTIEDLVKPFPKASSIDVTSELEKQNYTVHRMFETADGFFQSLGLKALPGPFWNKTMFVKPEDRDVVCHASAWDFYNAKDFRIKMCTVLTQQDLVTIHHEMGHIQYYLQYQHLPVIFREGANPGFHEAIGDTMALSAGTPAHLKKIGLLNYTDDHERDINFLMNMALQKIAFLPFGYLIDQWRWSVFRGDATPDNYNQEWWDLRCRYQGISAPVTRTNDDFDPGAKYHVAADVPYIRYFISYVIQFQFHKAACDAANHTGPLHQCDIYNSKAAGETIGKMLRLGSSTPWPQVMKLVTGSEKMDVGPLMEYFKPLIDHLRKENGNDYGWNPQCPPDMFDKREGSKSPPENIRQFLETYDRDASDRRYTASEAEWSYATNITDYNENVKINESLKSAEFNREWASKASKLNMTGLNDDVTRQLTKIKDVGTAAQPDQDKLKKYNEAISNMETIYSKGKVCFSSSDCHHLDPGLTALFEKSDDYDRLLKAWIGWRNVTGRLMKQHYIDYVKLKNEALQIAGHEDAGAYWRSWYDTPTFEDDVADLWAQLKPLYEHLHAYVRRKLKAKYGPDKFPSTGHIPAHLLGNMWAQQWMVDDLVKPFHKPSIDVTGELVKQNYTVLKMFHTADEFFQSLGLIKLPQEFWNKSMLVKPDDGREVVCHGSAWDFYNAKDFRIKMCTVKTQSDLTTVHHEMGHIQYFMQYMHQPQVYRDGANPGFHEAVGDTLALSVGTPEHLQKIKLLKNYQPDNETDINFLMSVALEKIAFLPFGYLIDQWRWSVFRGDTGPDHYNDKWWKLRCRIQGISSPVARSSSDFDPGAKYHIPSDVPYIRYFVSFVIQFQFHKAACDAAGNKGPLHHCDIYNSKEAGKLLGSMLKLGSSKPWPEAMKIMTGGEKMDASALMEYFKPLLEFLKKENGDDFGWDPKCPSFESQILPDPSTADNADNGSAPVVLVTFTQIVSLLLCLLLSLFIQM